MSPSPRCSTAAGCRCETASSSIPPQQAFARLQADGKPALLNLSENERTVMDYLSQGMLTPDIAMLMDVSPSTVKTYVSRATRKLGVGNRREAVAEWLRITNL